MGIRIICWLTEMAPYYFVAGLSPEAVPYVRRFLTTGVWSMESNSMGATSINAISQGTDSPTNRHIHAGIIKWHKWLRSQDRYGYDDGNLVMDPSMPLGADHLELCPQTGVWEAMGNLPDSDADDTMRTLRAFVRAVLQPLSDARGVVWDVVKNPP
jgi:hypothetical protein